MIPRFKSLLVACGVALCVQAPASAQAAPVQVNARLISRSEMEVRLGELEAAAQASDSSRAAREQARAEAELLRRRLLEGDFKVGDRILLYVEGEPTLSDTFAVNTGGAVQLPAIGDVSLRGVLRSELNSHMSDELSRYVRNARVRAHALMRVTVTGAVVTPGFHIVTSDMLLSDVIMRTAGGIAGQANLEELRVERDGEPLWEGDALRMAMDGGRTLDQLSLRAGDVVVLPARGGGALSVLQSVAVIMSIPVTIISLIAIF